MGAKHKKELKYYAADDVFDFEEELIRKQDKKLKKHYLKSDAKAFIHKFIRAFKHK